MKLILLALAVLLGGGGGLTALFGGQSAGQTPPASQQQVQSAGTAGWSQLLDGLGGGSVSSGWQSEANTGRLDTTVAGGSRDKYTQILGSGKDTATIMVYMCGTDLESRAGMGTSDLQEMLG
ncbi:MAG: peptidase C11, partial [Oscillospiraceae bacterium]|nr:peptidase C11 [Oscillospiraceae bacterium]